MKRPKRLYREVSVDRLEAGQWQVKLDTNPAATPAGNRLYLPTLSLAEAIAQEWRSQTAEIHPETMGLTRLANTAIDLIGPDRSRAVAEIVKFAGSDLLCFRASGPDLLVQRQSALWDPLLDWARERYGISLATERGVSPLRQPKEAVAEFETFLLQFDSFALTGLVAAVNILDSAVLALALTETRLGAAEAFAAAELDAIYQAEIWGADSEVVASNRKKRDEIKLISRFMSLITTV